MGNTAKAYSVVIEACNTDGVFDLESNTLSYNFSLACLHYYGILHSNDKKDDGTLKREHYHFILIFDKPIGKKRVIQLISFLNDIDVVRVSVRPTLCMIKEMRYLLHLDNPNKYMYEINSIITDDLERYKYSINRKTYFSEKTLLNMCENATSKSELLMNVGLDFYNRNYHFINDLWNSVRGK